MIELNDISSVYYPQEVLINLTLAFILGLTISLVYKKTHKGLSYSQSFMITNIFVAVIVCMVIMIIGNSLARAFALVGALSIIRFRTVVKDTKDTAHIFWSLAAGMASGTGSYFIAFSGTTILTIIAFMLHKSNFGSIIKSEFILQFRINTHSSELSESFIKIIQHYTKSNILLNSEVSDDGKTIKNSYDVLMQEEKNQHELIKKLSELNGLSEIVIIAAKNDVDY